MSPHELDLTLKALRGLGFSITEASVTSPGEIVVRLKLPNYR
jgi:hypothetical protein